MTDKSEAPKHYIDIEDFKKPIDSLPRSSKAAYKMYPDSFLRKTGSLPWHIQDMMDKLTNAFTKRSRTEILFLAGDLLRERGWDGTRAVIVNSVMLMFLYILLQTTTDNKQIRKAFTLFGNHSFLNCLEQIIITISEKPGISRMYRQRFGELLKNRTS